jgi:hypothetical protein
VINPHFREISGFPDVKAIIETSSSPPVPRRYRAAAFKVAALFCSGGDFATGETGGVNCFTLVVSGSTPK